MQRDLWIWRPILAGKCTLDAVKSGLVNETDLFKLNALLDMQNAMESYQSEMMQKANK